MSIVTDSDLFYYLLLAGEIDLGTGRGCALGDYWGLLLDIPQTVFCIGPGLQVSTLVKSFFCDNSKLLFQHYPLTYIGWY